MLILFLKFCSSEELKSALKLSNKPFLLGVKNGTPFSSSSTEKYDEYLH